MNEVDDDNVFYIELVEDYPCENHYQLRKREGELIREMKPTVNKQIECRTARQESLNIEGFAVITTETR